MFEIKGKINTAICYAKTIDGKAEEQIRRMCDCALTENSCIRIMPDVHAGKGCTIGTTMTITDKICPNIVGVDIGCGMYTVRLKEQKLNFQTLDVICHKIPSGMCVWDDTQEFFDLQQLHCYYKLKDVKRLERSLGTLGGGNHFIEVERASDGTYYLIIHSGSRNLGKQTAEIYQNIAIDLHRGKTDYLQQRDRLIEKYRNAGKQSEIQYALKLLEQQYREQQMEIPEDLCWLYGSDMNDYLHDVEICQQFAKRNREKMAEMILQHTGMTAVEAFHTIHNYIDMDEMILRKGAIAAHAGQKVLIPINMRDGSILAFGKGNPEWNESAPHGAGRIMSRAQAKRKLSLQEYQTEMQGIYTTCINLDTIDEAPMAYKSLQDIMDVVYQSVDIIDVMKPVYNFKATEEVLPWKKKKGGNI